MPEPRDANAESATIGVLFGEALAAPEAVWSLRAAGHQVQVISRIGSSPPASRIREVETLQVCAPEQSLSGCRRDLGRVVRDFGIDLLMPLDDVGVLVTGGSEFGAHLVGPRNERARLALDKVLQIEAARQVGLPVPRTESITTPADFRWAGPFPVVVKPADAVTVIDDRVCKGPTRVCADQGELDDAVSSLPHGYRYLVQELLHGEGRGVFGLSKGGRVVHMSGHRRVRMMNPLGSGSSACAPVGVAEEVAHRCERFVEQLDWSGMFMVELLLVADGRHWFMELNGRPWGSLALARRRGFEYPAWAVLLDAEPEYVPQVSELSDVRLCRNLAYEILHLFFVLRGPRTRSDIEWPTFWATLISLVRIGRGHRWYNWNRRQPTLLLHDVVWTLKRILMKK